jgi:hypothetical protein
MTSDNFTGLVFVKRRLCVFCEVTEFPGAYRLIVHFKVLIQNIYNISSTNCYHNFYHRHTTVIIIVIVPDCYHQSLSSPECPHHDHLLLYLSLSSKFCHHNQTATNLSYTKRMLSSLSLSSSYSCHHYRNHHQTAIVTLCHHQPPVIFITRLLLPFSTSSDRYYHYLYHHMLSSVSLSPPWC